MDDRAPMLFSPESSGTFAADVAGALQVDLAPLEARVFEDGEHKTRPLASVRGRDVYVLQSLFSGDGHSVNDRTLRLLFFVAAIRDAGAARVSAVIPYLGYARKDRRTKPRDPVYWRMAWKSTSAAGLPANSCSRDPVPGVFIPARAGFSDCRARSLRVLVLFPEPEGVPLGVNAVGKVALCRHRHFRCDDFAAELLHLPHRGIDGLHTEIIHHPLRGIHPFPKTSPNSRCPVKVRRADQVEIHPGP